MTASDTTVEWGQHVLEFYSGRNYVTAWFIGDSLIPQAIELIAGIERAVKEGLDTTGWNIESLKHNLTEANNIPAADHSLTESFFRFALFEGLGVLRNKAKPNWDHPSRAMDIVACLDSILDGAPLSILSPQKKGFEKLRQSLRELHLVAQAGGWDTTFAISDKIEPGRQHQVIPQLRKRLNVPPRTDSLLYDSVLVDAVKTFQAHNGLHPDGIIAASTVAALNVSVRQRMKQIMVNMERMKWLPDDMGGTRVVANLPEYAVRVYVVDTIALTMRSVIGTKRNKTPVFHDTIKFLVMRPYWNVPSSITNNEILPELANDPAYLAAHQYEVVYNGKVMPDSVDLISLGSSYRIRQRPGNHNALGTVKFMFPNDHWVYMHDTNAKNYFDRWPRAYSHGCVRIDRPTEFAELLLRDQPQWTSESIEAARTKGGEKMVNLKTNVPVWLLYLTCTRGEDGTVHFWDDVYGYDREVWEMMNATKRPLN